MNDLPSRHPDPASLAAFIDGGLTTAQTNVIAGHLNACSECRGTAGEASRFEREEEALAGELPARARRWTIAAAAAVLVAIGASLFVARQRTTDPIARLAAAASRTGRDLEPRLSGFPWTRLAATRGSSQPNDPSRLKLHGVAGDVIERSTTRSPRDLHASGLAYLLIGENVEAVKRLTSASQATNEGAIWNDLAAALYARATSKDTPSDFGPALHAADRAIAAKMPEAHFNRALILEHLGDRAEARKAWNAYLAVDSSSEWANEARHHLRTLDDSSSGNFPKELERVAAEVNAGRTAGAEGLLRRFPQESRSWGEGPLFARWAGAEQSGRTEDAARELNTIRAIGDALARADGEHLLSDEVNLVDRSTPSVRRVIAAAHLLYDSGRRQYSRRMLAEGEKDLLAAANLFKRSDSPMAAVATLSAANTQFDQNRLDESRELTRTVLRRADSTRHRALYAQVLWAIAKANAIDGQWSAAVEAAGKAGETFSALGETANQASVESIKAGALDRMAQYDEAWRVRIRALDRQSRGDPARLPGAIANAVRAEGNRGAFESALALSALLVNHLQSSHDALLLTDAHMQRARAFHGLHDGVAAAESIRAARAEARRLQNPALRRRMEADADVIEAVILRGHDRARSLQLATAAIDLYEQNHDAQFLPAAYLERSRTLIANGERDAAVADLERAIAGLEKQRSSVADLDARMRFLDVEPELYGTLIDLQLNNGETTRAFETSERFRARTLQEQVAPAQPPAVLAGARSAVLEYAFTPDGLAIFCVTPAGIEAERLRVDHRGLVHDIDSFRALIEKRAPLDEIRLSGARLYRTLIEPVAARIDGVESLTLVADRDLQRVPFAALYDERRHTYLIERHAIRLAPSARFRATRNQPGEVLVIAAAGARDGRLPEVRNEAEAIAGLYPAATLLSAPSRAAVMESASRSSVIHFAGHARTSDDLDDGSLQLGGDTLSARDIAQLRLLRGPVVTLAACGTLRGAQHLEGSASLNRSFLAAGASAVIGTLWDVDDDVAARAFRDVHGYFRRGASSIDATRLVQLDLLHSPDPRLSHPASWAAIALLGSATTQPADRRER